MPEEIEWGEPPPPKKRPNGTRLLFVEELRAHPGQWGKYPGSASAASAVSGFKQVGPDLEWTVRKRPDGRFDIYGRFNPTTDKSRRKQ